ncbi:MAG: DUF523 and DUF1722 domain-containing protein [Acidobacteriota bacterium]|jgi:uncharacterized protein YbgA (DUF1722 family)/uncharacterized protein YbbK (DUF523 family)
MRPRVGISLCLLGEEVRHDGGHKRARYVTDVLAEYFEWAPLCPEVDVGMGIPREPIHLVADGDTVRLVGIRSERDWTEEMARYARAKVEELAAADIDGFILKKDSPSCGMERVKLFNAKNMPTRDGVGAFARVLMERMTTLPVEEEGRLNDAGLRENFITRVYAYQRWRALLREGLTAGNLVDFHTRHKLLLLAHSPSHYYRLGPLVAEAGARDLGELAPEYERLLMAALARPASRQRQVNTLHHLCGFLKDELDAAEKAELLDVIEQYRRGIVPIVAPLTLLRAHLRRIEHPWVNKQVYLAPYPRDLGLRSHV